MFQLKREKKNRFNRKSNSSQGAKPRALNVPFLVLSPSLRISLKTPEPSFKSINFSIVFPEFRRKDSSFVNFREGYYYINKKKQNKTQKKKK